MITWLRSSSIFLDGYGSKVRKVSRCRPAISSVTILATRQEFFYKSSSRTKHYWHCIIRFLINSALLNVHFILYYYLFFCNEIYFLECLYFSECHIRMSLYVFWLKKGQTIKYVRNWWGKGVSPKMRKAGYRG